MSDAKKELEEIIERAKVSHPNYEPSEMAINLHRQLQTLIALMGTSHIRLGGSRDAFQLLLSNIAGSIWDATKQVLDAEKAGMN